MIANVIANVIRVVFQDQAIHMRKLFRGAKTCKIGEKGVFWSYSQILEEMDMLEKFLKKSMHIFIPGKYVLKLCFESPFTRMISRLKYKFPLYPPASNQIKHGVWFPDREHVNTLEINHSIEEVYKMGKKVCYSTQSVNNQT